MQEVSAISLALDAGGRSQALSISGTSAQSKTLNGPNVVVSPTVDCFVRADNNPTAVSDGTDIFLFGGNAYRLQRMPAGQKLAFITTGASGTVYITPGA